MTDKNRKTFRSNRGFSVIELLVVMLVVGILTAIAVPAMLSQRRVLRSVSLGREIMAQMRLARQLAMSDRQSVTFEYNDNTKQIRVINHHNNHVSKPVDPVYGACVLGRKEILGAAGYPDTACAKVVSIYALTQGGLTASEIEYGIPAGFNTGALADSIAKTSLTGGKLLVTFQTDGSVLADTGLPQDTAMYFFNNKAKKSTASAISVVGASGRAKVWRYRENGNIYGE